MEMKLIVGKEPHLFDSEATLNAIQNTLIDAKSAGVVRIEHVIDTTDFGFSEQEENLVTAACLWISEKLKVLVNWGFVQHVQQKRRIIVFFLSEQEYNKVWESQEWRTPFDHRADKLWNPKAVWNPDFLKDYPIRRHQPHDPAQYYGMADYMRSEFSDEPRSIDVRLKSDFSHHFAADRFFQGKWGGKQEIPHSRSIQARMELKKFVEIHVSHIPPFYRDQVVKELLDGVDGSVWDQVDGDENVKVEASIKRSEENGQPKITLIVDLLKIKPKAVDGISIE